MAKRSKRPANRAAGSRAKSKSKGNSRRGSNSRTRHPPLKAPPTADDPFPYDTRLDKSIYEETLHNLQIELLKVQRWTKDSGQKIVIIFEGRDAAGKGGTIKRFREYLNPRGARVVALNKPNETELGQWYFQRYVTHLPTAGEIVFFDRSWYNRAGVEPVMGFCTPEQYLQFMHQVPSFERGLIDSDVRLFKFWFDVGRDEQKRRMDSRKTDPLKQWKLSPIDAKAMKLWGEYTKARDSMFFYSDTREAPWQIIRSDDKRRARIGAILTVLNQLPYPDKDQRVVTPCDPLIAGAAETMVPMKGRMIFEVVRA